MYPTFFFGNFCSSSSSGFILEFSSECKKLRMEMNSAPSYTALCDFCTAFNDDDEAVVADDVIADDVIDGGDNAHDESG
jgi:hypothetical protein